jgi:hypothetical protein
MTTEVERANPPLSVWLVIEPAGDVYVGHSGGTKDSAMVLAEECDLIAEYLPASRSLAAEAEVATYERAIAQFDEWLGGQAEFFKQNPQVNRTFLDCAARLMKTLRTVRHVAPPSPPVAPEPAPDPRLAHTLANPPGPRHARLVEPAQEAGGMEGVSHADARDCLRSVAGKREHDTLWRYIDQQLLQQEATGRESDELRDKLVRAIALAGNWQVAIEGALGVESDDSEHTPQWAYERVLAIREIGNGVRDESGPIDPFAAEYSAPRCAIPGCIYAGGHLGDCFDPALREQTERAAEPLTAKQLARLLRRLSDVCFATGGKVTHFELAWLADQLEAPTEQVGLAAEGRSA